jgi:soluble lytic murein transglycosylase-like protein
MKKKRWFLRLQLKAAVIVFTLALVLASQSSDTAVPSQEVRQKDLASWVVHGEEGPRRAVTRADLDSAISAEERGELTLFLLKTEKAKRGVLHSLPYGKTLVAAAERHGVDGLLLAAIVRHESSFDPEIVSPKGAVGLMQLLPSTGRAYGAEDLFNPGVNLDAGSRYLSHLLALYDGDLELALAAYNAGPTAVARYGGIPPYRETRQYVRRVKAEYERLKDRVNRA